MKTTIINKASNTPIISSRKKRAIVSKAQDFVDKAKENLSKDQSKNLLEFYQGCVHGIAVVCNMLNMNPEEIIKLQKELSEL